MKHKLVIYKGLCVDGPLKDRELSGGYPFYELKKHLDARTVIVAGEYRYYDDEWHWKANS